MTLELVDTHCHLDPSYFPAGPDEALSRAAGEHVVGFVVVGVGSDLGPARAALGLAEAITRAIQAIDCLQTQGIDAAMNQFN